MSSMQLVIGLKECDPLWLILFVLLIKYTVVFLDTLILFVFQSRSHFDLCQLKMADGQQINHQTYNVPKYIRTDLFSYKPTSFLDTISLNVS